MHLVSPARSPFPKWARACCAVQFTYVQNVSLRPQFPWNLWPPWGLWPTLRPVNTLKWPRISKKSPWDPGFPETSQSLLWSDHVHVQASEITHSSNLFLFHFTASNSLPQNTLLIKQAVQAGNATYLTQASLSVVEKRMMNPLSNQSTSMPSLSRSECVPSWSPAVVQSVWMWSQDRKPEPWSKFYSHNCNCWLFHKSQPLLSQSQRGEEEPLYFHKQIFSMHDRPQ